MEFPNVPCLTPQKLQVSPDLPTPSSFCTRLHKDSDRYHPCTAMLDIVCRLVYEDSYTYASLLMKISMSGRDRLHLSARSLGIGKECHLRTLLSSCLPYIVSWEELWRPLGRAENSTPLSRIPMEETVWYARLGKGH